ncbi:TraM recognition domain-containing protein [Neisseriaceae bacterium PsAf]|nr:TraM recognition domain-containing protein [Neisseriaceae bacterium PsAf]MCV2503533.1 type IV secretory system conjugative DNA transfer family protein [Neisseriaceae bacterium]
MNRPKVVFFSIFFICTLIIVLYLTGFVAVEWARVKNMTLTPWSIITLLSEFKDHPSAGVKIKISAFIGAIVFLTANLGLLYLLIRTKTNLFGNARFASSSELQNKGFFSPDETALVVGKKNGRFLFYNGQQFAILAAPTRSGKGVGIVIPNLLSYKGSMVVLDIKQENFELTSGFRKAHGQEVFLFNPMAEDRKTHRWNPLSYISEDPAFRTSDLQNIAAMLYPDVNDEQKFWVSNARNAFLAFALYSFDLYRFNYFKEAYKPTLGMIYRLSSGDGHNELKDYFRSLASQDFVSSEAKMAFSTLTSQSDDVFSSIMGTFKEPLNLWINPVVDAATSGDDFLLSDVRKKKMTIYIGIQPNKLAESRLIINLFFNQLINLNTKELPQHNPDLKYQCVLLMDEFTSIGRVDIIAKAVSYMAGYNIRLFPIIQSMAQLDATYGKDLSRNIITNHSLQILYAPREQRDANDYSEMLGYNSVKRESISRTQGRLTRSENEEKRALMLPQELKAMGPDKQILVYEGLENPVMCEKIKYYEDKVFKNRLYKKVNVPTITITSTSKTPVNQSFRQSINFDFV